MRNLKMYNNRPLPHAP